MRDGGKGKERVRRRGERKGRVKKGMRGKKRRKRKGREGERGEGGKGGDWGKGGQQCKVEEAKNGLPLSVGWNFRVVVGWALVSEVAMPRQSEVTSG